MVTRYDVISSRWSSQFWVKIHVFLLLLTITVNLMAKIMQSAYLCVIFRVEHKKLPILAVLTWFLILGKIQEDQRLSTKGKIVSKYCNISKTPRRGSVHPPPLYHSGDMNLRVRPTVKLFNLVHIQLHVSSRSFQNAKYRYEKPRRVC